MDKKFLMSSLLTGSQMPMFDLRIAAHDEIERLEAALKDIAKQKKTDELETEYDVEVADFETGYDTIIDVARKALNSSW